MARSVRAIALATSVALLSVPAHAVVKEYRITGEFSDFASLSGAPGTAAEPVAADFIFTTDLTIDSFDALDSASLELDFGSRTAQFGTSNTTATIDAGFDGDPDQTAIFIDGQDPVSGPAGDFFTLFFAVDNTDFTLLPDGSGGDLIALQYIDSNGTFEDDGDDITYQANEGAGSLFVDGDPTEETATVIPVPPALPMLAAGLGLLGLIGGRARA